MSERVILIDGTAVIYRAFFAIPSAFTTSSGLHTNAIYGFARMFQKLLAGKAPKYAVMVFDAPGKTFREEKYPDYKAQRPHMPGPLAEQLPWIDKVVEAHDFPVLKITGVEADDVIGTLTEKAVADGFEVHIISGDKDFAQLIRPEVKMIDTMRDITYDEELAKKKWGVPPNQFVDFLALLGDKSDNIPGVPGIGKKGAAQLLEKFGDLDTILDSTDQLKGRQQTNLREFREQALMSRDLATIKLDVEIDVAWEDLEYNPPDLDKVNALYHELEFYSLLDDDKGHEPVEDQESYSIVYADDVDEMLARLEMETPGVYPVFQPHDPVHGELVGFAFGVANDDAWWVPLRDLNDPRYETLKAYLASEHPKIAHDLRDLLCAFQRHQGEFNGCIADTQTASFLINPTKLIPHGLSQVVKEYLQKNLTPIKTITGAGKKEKSLLEIDDQELGPWACHMAVAIAQVWPPVSEKLEEEGHVERLQTLAMPMAKVLADMQYIGVRVDPDDLLEMEEEFTRRRDAVEQEVHELAGRKFNLGSPKQLSKVLFEELELPVIKRTKTGYSTNKEVMERLAPKHDIAQKIIRWRKLAKLINTYTKVLRESRSEKTERIHTTFQQTAGSSGRLITTNPDLQRTPIRGEDGKRIRKAFIPRDGWRFISADWSQIELRVLAHMSEDSSLVYAFENDLDLHRQTASRIFDIELDEVTKKQREMGKTVNFATIYGQGATALGQQLGIKRTEAAAMIERYFEVYSDVADWRDETIEDAHFYGYVETILGRRRYIPELKSNNPSDKSYGERIASNTPIQGSAADICKLAMMKIFDRFNEEQLESKMMVQIHDELLFEAPPSELDHVLEIIRECMRTPYPLNVPLKVDIGVGDNWAEAH